MRILMFGWEFPPYMSGGLGTACLGITEALVELGHDILFVLPHMDNAPGPVHLELIPAPETPGAGHREEETPECPGLSLRPVHSPLRPYLDDHRYQALLADSHSGLLAQPGSYGPNLMSEVVRYGRAAGVVARERAFDVIHAHDWMAIPAGLETRRISGKPLILHIHALEFDRCGDNINQVIYDMERSGMEAADQVIAVSHYTKDLIIQRYGINPDKITVVHNAVAQRRTGGRPGLKRRSRGKIVLFLGRVTFQKGPDYFIDAAAKVLAVLPGTTFIMAGAGDMTPRMIERVAALGIGQRFHFTGFLKDGEVERIFAISDLYIMPSVSEPFGIAPLEAMLHDVPVIISRQSGVSEILHHALTVDFWNVDDLADKIAAALKHPALATELVERSRLALENIRWEAAAVKITAVYRRAVEMD
jgi:glycogen synthase